MHRHLKRSHLPARASILQQQTKFDAFLEEELNHERPQALSMRCPAEILLASSRLSRHPRATIHFTAAPSWSLVADAFALYKKIGFRISLAGQAVGIKEVEDGIWLASFYELRFWLY